MDIGHMISALFAANNPSICRMIIDPTEFLNCGKWTPNEIELVGAFFYNQQLAEKFPDAGFRRTVDGEPIAR